MAVIATAWIITRPARSHVSPQTPEEYGHVGESREADDRVAVGRERVAEAAGAVSVAGPTADGTQRHVRGLVIQRADAQPLTGCDVLLKSGTVDMVGSTDARGAFSLALLDGVMLGALAEVVVIGPDKVAEFHGVATLTHDMLILVDSLHHLVVRLVDEQGRPVVDAWLTVSGRFEADQRAAISWRGKSDHEGMVRFRRRLDPDALPHRLLLRAGSGDARYSREVDAQDLLGSTYVMVLDGEVMQVLVLDSQRNPCPDVPVAALSSGNHGDSEWTSVRTDARGVAVLSLPAGEVTLVARVAGHAMARHQVAIGDDWNKVTIRAEPLRLGKLTGRVTGPNGDGLAETKVTIFPHYPLSDLPLGGHYSAMTDAAGAFSLTAPFQELPFRLGCASPLGRQWLVVRDLDGEVNVQIQSWARLRVTATGDAVEASDGPIRYFVSHAESGVSKVGSASQVPFEIDGLNLGEHELRVVLPDLSMGAALRVTTPEMHWYAVSLPLTQITRIRGRIIDEYGRPVSGRAVAMEGCLEPWARDRSRRDGRFSVATTSAGRGLVRLKVDGVAATLDVASGDDCVLRVSSK